MRDVVETDHMTSQYLLQRETGHKRRKEVDLLETLLS